jgi:methylenetetrahydrofolate reductase (NADPH)
MTLAQLVSDPRPIAVSFEFSPPKTAEAEASLWNAIRRLEPLSPSFVSVTYGAGGTTRERTHATVKRIVEETSLKPAAHLTCVGAPRGEIDDIVRGYWTLASAISWRCAVTCRTCRGHTSPMPKATNPRRT